MKHHTKQNGFTLIELLVAIGIFGIFITIITGVFTRFILVERHSIAQGQLIADLRSGLESFVKEARTGYGSTYNVTSDGKSVAFRNQARECVEYRVGSDGILKRAAAGNPGGGCAAGGLPANLFSPLTSTQTNIDEVHFNVIIGQTNGSAIAPRLINQGVITVSLHARSSSADILPVELENTVVSRQMLVYQ